jgi:DNA-binding NarL/FixJ family response regulator
MEAQDPLLIVHGHPLSRQGVKAIINLNLVDEVVRENIAGDTAVQTTRELQPDLPPSQISIRIPKNYPRPSS